jgi:hypothetical protein
MSERAGGAVRALLGPQGHTADAGKAGEWGCAYAAQEACWHKSVQTS